MTTTLPGRTNGAIIANDDGIRETANGRINSSGTILLRNGTTGCVREVRPTDRAALRTLHGSLSETSNYHRFLCVGSHRAREFVDEFVTCLQDGDGFGQVCLIGGRIVGLGSGVMLDKTSAEVAFVVADELHGLGIGTLLLERLADQAEKRGVEEFLATVLTTNQKSLDMLRNSGFIGRARRSADAVDVRFPVRKTERLHAAMTERARVASLASMWPLLEPSSVAVVGAGRAPGSPGHDVLRNLLAAGFAGPIHPVNPSIATVQGLACYPSVLDLPYPVGLAIIATPASFVPRVIDECATAGVRAVVVLSSGYAEDGPDGKRRQDELSARVRAAGMRLVGPNCLGVANTRPDVRLDGVCSTSGQKPGNVGLLTQSNLAGTNAMRTVRELGIGVSAILSVGNKADVSGNDALAYFSWDDRTDVIALQVESLGNPRTFSRMARVIGCHKPIVALVGCGSSGGGQAREQPAATSGTSAVAVDALLEQCGVIQARSLRQFLHVTTVLAEQPLPPGDGVAIVGNGIGSAELAVAAFDKEGLDLADLAPATATKIRDLLPAAASVANPIDLGADATGNDLSTTMDLLAEDENVHVIVVLQPATHAMPTEVFESILTRAATRGRGVLTVVVDAARTDSFDEEYDKAPSVTRRGGIAVFRCPEDAAEAIGPVLAYRAWRESDHGSVVSFHDTRPREARRLVTEELARRPEGHQLHQSAAR